MIYALIIMICISAAIIALCYKELTITEDRVTALNAKVEVLLSKRLESHTEDNWDASTTNSISEPWKFSTDKGHSPLKCKDTCDKCVWNGCDEVEDSDCNSVFLNTPCPYFAEYIDLD